MKLIIDVPEETFTCLKNMIEAECVDPYSLADIIVNNGIPVSTEGDLISRSELRKDIERLYSVYKDNKDYFYTDVLDHIDNAPTVEKVINVYPNGEVIVQEKRPQGKWYYNYQNGWHCSICHESVKDMPTVMGKADFRFCPNCGADMRGKENDTKRT